MVVILANSYIVKIISSVKAKWTFFRLQTSISFAAYGFASNQKVMNKKSAFTAIRILQVKIDV
jgi:hypothetical protein